MTQKEILEKAIQKAIDGGWKHKTPDDATRRVDNDPFKDVIQYWDIDWRVELEGAPAFYHLIFNHDFAKALWGNSMVDNNGWDLKAIRVWANQVAVRHLDKLYRVDPDKRHGEILSTPKMDYSEVLSDPLALVSVEKIRYELTKMVAQIPFETHEMKSLEIEAKTKPNWQYHLQQMVVSDDPVKYLGENI